jgi:hypothetical protein
MPLRPGVCRHRRVGAGRPAATSRNLGPATRNAGRAIARRIRRLRLRHQWRPAGHAAGRLAGRPESSGLREVYFRYDDELEYWAKANNLAMQMEQYSGTKTYGFPITVSALIDDGGTLRGIRLVSDPRGDSQNRDEAYLLRNFLTARFGRDGWRCENLPPAEGETPVGGIFVKERCHKDIDATTTASLTTRHLRKAGQSQFDPRTGRETTGQFESTVRFELIRNR